MSTTIAKTIGTIAHISPGSLTAQVAVICEGLNASAGLAEALTKSLKENEVVDLPVAYETGRRTRTRGNKPSPGQRVVLNQQRKRLSGR